MISWSIKVNYTHRHRQTTTQPHRDTHKHTHTYTETHTQMHTYTYAHTHTHAHAHTDRQTDRQTDRHPFKGTCWARDVVQSVKYWSGTQSPGFKLQDLIKPGLGQAILGCLVSLN